MQLSMVWKQITLQQWPTVGWQQSSYINSLTTRLQHWSAASWVFSRGRAIATVLVALVFAAAPFVSTTLIGLLLLVCAGIWTLLVFTDSDRPPLTPVHLMVLSYWSITTIATGFSPVRTAAVDGWVKLSLYLMLFALLVRLLRSPRIRSILIGVYLHIALIVSAAGLRQWFFGADALATWVDPESSLAGTTRVYSYLGNPNLLAGYLIPATFLSVAAFFVWGDSLAKIRQQSATWLTPVAQLKESQPKLWAILWTIAFGIRLFVTPKGLALIMAIVHSTCLVVTFSRGGWLGFLAGSFVLLLLMIHWIGPHLPKFWRRWSLPLVLGGSTGSLVVAIATISPIQERFFSIFAGHEDSSNSFRLFVWQGVTQMIQARPWLGIGPGNDAFNMVYPFYQVPGYTALSAYSILLEIWVETGIIGLLCFLWLIVVALVQGWIAIQRLRQTGDRQGFWLMAAIATIFGMMAHGAVDTVWYRPQVSVLWWLTIAIVASYYQPPQSAAPPSPPSAAPSSPTT